MTTLDDINVRRITDHAAKMVRESLMHFVGDPIDATTLLKIETTTKHVLAGCGMLDPEVDAEEKQLTWRDLYPNLRRRLLARVAAFCLRRKWMQLWNERWYHHVFPFTIQHMPAPSGDDLDAIGVALVDGNRELAGDLVAAIGISTWISLAEPYRIVVAKVKFRPAHPADYIRVNLTLGAG